MLMKNKTSVNWYDLKEYEILYLKEDVFKSLIKQGIAKAGSLSKLCAQIKSNHFYSILKKNRGMSVKNLKKLLAYLNINFSFLNDKILEVRKGLKVSIKNPNFPINLTDSRLGSVLGHVISDGCVYYDKSSKNLIRTKYYSDTIYGLNLFLNDITDIFGQVHFTQEYERNCYTVRIGNGIIGEVLRRAGLSIGKRSDSKVGLPRAVKKGGKELKKAYLSAIFDDEGSVGKINQFPYVILSRNIHVCFSNKEKIFLDTHIVPLMKTNTFPTGHITRRIPIRQLKKTLTENKRKTMLKKILNSKPKLLVEESNLLKKEFGINNHTYVISLQLTSNSFYSIQSCMVIRNKKDILKFYKEICFSLPKKQDKLKNYLKEANWNNGSEDI